jgi:hypothetical protein
MAIEIAIVVPEYLRDAIYFNRLIFQHVIESPIGGPIEALFR